MPKTSSVRFALFTVLFIIVYTPSIFAMVYDNRYIPLIAAPRLSLGGSQSYLNTDVIFATASRGYGIRDNEIGIAEINGFFDQAVLARAMVKAGYQNPLLSEWTGYDIPRRINGKLQAQGVAIETEMRTFDWLYVGCSMLCMRSNQYQEFNLQFTPSDDIRERVNLDLSTPDKQELDEILRNMFTTLGLQENYTGQVGFGDIDSYLRFGNTWEYTLKCRRIDAGFRLGVLIPTGRKQEFNMPGSIPFGGNGHWGIYGALDGLFELRENIKVGVLVRINQRFSKTSCYRLPVLTEPQQFGAAVGQAQVKPGATYIFSPYFVLEGLLQGFGINVGYTLTAHEKDRWIDKRSDVQKQALRINLNRVRKESKWGSDYATINLFYDFAKVNDNRLLKPILSLRWDIPALFFITKRVAKTNRITLSIEFAF